MRSPSLSEDPTRTAVLTGRARSGTSWIALRRALIAFGALLVAINVGSALWSIRFDRARVERDALRSFSNLAALLAEQTAGSLEAVELLLRDVGSEIDAAGVGDREALRERLRARVAGMPQVRALLVIGPDGRLLVSTGAQAPADLDLADRPFFRRPWEDAAGSPFFSAPFRGRVSGRWQFAVSERLATPRARFAGVAAALIDIEYFDRPYRALDVGEGGFLSLLTTEGAPVTSLPMAGGAIARRLGDTPGVRAALRRDGRFAGWARSPDEASPMLVSAATVRGLPLEVFVGTTERAVFAPWREEAWRIGLQALVTSAAILALVAFAGRELARRAAADVRVRGHQEMLDLAQGAAQAAAFEWRLGAGAAAENRWSPSLEPMLGLAPGGYDGTYGAWNALVHPEDRPGVAAAIERARETGDVSTEYRVVDRDGSVHWLQLKGRLLTDANGDPARLAGFMLDVTDRRQAEAEGQRQKVLLDELFESAPEAVVLLDLEGRVIRTNREFGAIFGYRPEEAAGRPLFDLIVPEDQLEAARALNAIYASGTPVATECERRRKDGTRIDVSLVAAPIMLGGKRIGVYAIYRDITERKLAEAEQARLQARLRQAEKMEAVGRLAGGIAHDFNNILGGILGYSEMLFAEAAEGTPVKRYSRNILTGANRARDLVDQILVYSRSQRAKRVPVEIDRVVGETFDLVRGSLAAGIALELALPPTPLVVVGDPTQLHQIVMNLCANAIQAMGESGTLRVALEPVDVPAERSLAQGTLAQGTLAPGSYVRLTVADTGRGMDAATLARIFEPFFTTKEVGRGTGLGLSLVYGIVTDSGGAINVASERGHGSTFEIYLPRSDARAAVAATAEAPVPRGSGERVLLVDDEESLTVMTAEVLAQLGYEAAAFTDGREALAAFELAPEAFHVVVTDEVMPVLTGTEIARRVRRLRPDLPVVLMSGYSGPILTQRALGAGVSELLKKPVQSRELATALARALRRAA